MTLVPPPLPELPDLSGGRGFREKHAALIAEARERAAENARLVRAIAEQSALADRNRYGLEVMDALARFMGHQWRLILGLAEAERLFDEARAAARRKDPREAVAHLTAAYESTGKIEQDLQAVFAAVTETFEKAHYPRGRTWTGARSCTCRTTAKITLPRAGRT